MARIEREHPSYQAGKMSIRQSEHRTGSPRIADTAAEYSVYFKKGENKHILGWMQVHYRLRFDENGHPLLLHIMDKCVNTIRVLPLMVYDENKPEDVDTDLEDYIPGMPRHSYIFSMVSSVSAICSTPIGGGCF